MSALVPSLSKDEIRRVARTLWEESYAADPIRTMENTAAVLSREVFAWDLLTVRELNALRRAVFPCVLEARSR